MQMHLVVCVEIFSLLLYLKYQIYYIRKSMRRIKLKRGRNRRTNFSPSSWSGATTAQSAHVDVVVPTRERDDLDLAHIERRSSVNPLHTRRLDRRLNASLSQRAHLLTSLVRVKTNYTVF